MKSLLFLATLAAALPVCAQSADKLAAFKNLIDSQNYVFRARMAIPISGQSHNLTSEYDVKVTTSAITSDLPYYGHAYTAVSPNDGGIRFTSRDFTYTANQRKKGGWEVLIKPKDLQGDVRQLSLTISSDGYATLRVISNNRDAISFDGRVTAPDTQ